MSVLSRKRAAEAEAAETRGRMRQLVWLTVPARAAVPMAKTAGMATRDGVRSAAKWTAPRINDARAWTAPRIEWSGLAIRDTIAPKVCETLTAAARRVDVTAPRPGITAPRRRWPWVVAGTGVLVAVGAAAAVVLQRRKDDRAFGEAGEPAEAVTSPQAAQNGQRGADADGSDAEEDVSRQSPAT
jgi:hypothetical protein